MSIKAHTRNPPSFWDTTETLAIICINVDHIFSLYQWPKSPTSSCYSKWNYVWIVALIRGSYQCGNKTQAFAVLSESLGESRGTLSQWLLSPEPQETALPPTRLPGSMRTQLDNGVIPRAAVPGVTVHTSPTALAPLRCSPWLPTHTSTSALANSFPPLWLLLLLGHFVQINKESLQAPEQCNCKQVDNSLTVLNLSLASPSLMANVPEDEKPGSV